MKVVGASFSNLTGKKKKKSGVLKIQSVGVVYIPINSTEDATGHREEA